MGDGQSKPAPPPSTQAKAKAKVQQPTYSLALLDGCVQGFSGNDKVRIISPELSRPNYLNI